MKYLALALWFSLPLLAPDSSSCLELRKLSPREKAQIKSRNKGNAPEDNPITYPPAYKVKQFGEDYRMRIVDGEIVIDHLFKLKAGGGYKVSSTIKSPGKLTISWEWESATPPRTTETIREENTSRTRAREYLKEHRNQTSQRGRFATPQSVWTQATTAVSARLKEKQLNLDEFRQEELIQSYAVLHSPRLFARYEEGVRVTGDSEKEVTDRLMGRDENWDTIYTDIQEDYKRVGDALTNLRNNGFKEEAEQIAESILSHLKTTDVFRGR